MAERNKKEIQEGHEGLTCWKGQKGPELELDWKGQKRTQKGLNRDLKGTKKEMKMDWKSISEWLKSDWKGLKGTKRDRIGINGTVREDKETERDRKGQKWQKRYWGRGTEKGPKRTEKVLKRIEKELPIDLDQELSFY